MTTTKRTRSPLWALRRRWRLSATIIAAILVTTVVATALVPARYESHATLLTKVERDTLIALLKSDDFQDAVSARLDGEEVEGSVRIYLALRRTINEEQSLVRITGVDSDPARSRALVAAHLAELPAWRHVLDAAVRDARWPTIYAESGYNATLAEERMAATLDGIEYYQTLETPETPSQPTAPSWGLNLFAGAVLAVSLGIVAPLLAPFPPATGRPTARARDDNEPSTRKLPP